MCGCSLPCAQYGNVALIANDALKAYEGIPLETIPLEPYTCSNRFATAHCTCSLHPATKPSRPPPCRERLRQNPSLVNCCTIDWFQAWPADALEAVANKLLREMDLDTRMRTSLMLLCQQLHERVAAGGREFLAEAGRHTYVTPTSYLELLAAFRSLQEAKRAENARLRKRCAAVAGCRHQNIPRRVSGRKLQTGLLSALHQDAATGLPVADPSLWMHRSWMHCISSSTPAPPADAVALHLPWTCHRYLTGLEKLASSAEQVAGMKAELVALQPQLVTTVADVEALMAKVAREKAEVVEPQAAAVKEEEAKAQGAADAAKAIKDECEADLAVVGAVSELLPGSCMLGMLLCCC
jgi:hypothetical protein